MAGTVPRRKQRINGGSRVRLSVIPDAQAVADSWTESGYHWVVAHGLEGYPDRMGRDLDILMEPAQAVPALADARRVLCANGWTMFVCPSSLWDIRMVALRRLDEGVYGYLELHTMGQLTWALLPIADTSLAVGEHRGPFPTSRWISFAKGVLMPLLAGDLSRFNDQYLARHRIPEAQRDEARSQLGRLVGDRSSDRLLTAVERVDAAAVRGLAPALRRAAIARMVRSPRQSLRSTRHLVIHRVAQAFSRHGVRVSLRVAWDDDQWAELATMLGRVFGSVVVTEPGSVLARIRHQYHTLAGQGAVVEVTQPSLGAPLAIGIASGLRRSVLTEHLEPDANPATAADWIVRSWAELHGCDRSRR